MLLRSDHRQRYSHSKYNRTLRPNRPFPAIQTLGEEYTDIWQYSSRIRTAPPPAATRAALIIASLVPSYALGRWGHSNSLTQRYPALSKYLRKLPAILETATEVNLAIFYLKGTYYDLVKRAMGIQHVSRSIISTVFPNS